MSTNSFLSITVILFWAGFVSSISFMEAWLKFRVEGVTLNIGLRIGKRIFRALNRMEWVFLISYTILQIYGFNTLNRLIATLSILLFVILALQTFYLLPRLEKRIDLILAGENMVKSKHHLYFIAAEILKVSILFGLAYCVSNV
jgi:hypothetical protein